jgi:hypothetical protein
MATRTPTGLTLVEVAKRLAPDGSQAKIAEVLAEKNDILNDIPFRAANDTFVNKTLRRSQEPAGQFRKLNEGISPGFSKTTVKWDVIGLLESYGKHDIEVINNMPDPKGARNDENVSHIAGMGKTMATTLLYGNTITTPEQFNGLAPRLDDISDSPTVIGAGGSSGTTSIFLVDWGPDTVHGLYPKNSVAGLDHQNLGIQIVLDPDSLEYRAYVDWFTWRMGLAVKNPKSIGRVANIEASGASNIFDEDLLIKVIVQMTQGPGMRIYVNKTVMAQMWIRLKDKTNVHFTRIDGLDAGGAPMAFNGIPIRQVDKIVDTEVVVPA